MKTKLILVLLTALYSLGFGQPTISKLSFLESVPLFGLYEIAFDMDNYDNPYDPAVIDVFAKFVAPDGKTFKVNGFYYEGYTFSQKDGYEKARPNAKSNGWRVRFTPIQTGTWTFSLHAIDRKGKTSMSSDGYKTFSFSCEPVENGTGFITKANSKYLKRDVVANGEQRDNSYFPVGPNVAWYDCKTYYDYTKPTGIYFYERYIDSLAGNANYMRIWLSRYQYLSLYGPEFALGEKTDTTVFFNSTLNQKDAAELDHIITYAAQHDISVMPCFFSFGDFRYDGTDSKGPGKWTNNPYHTLLGLEQPHEFFSDREARKIAKNLLRYIVARWGYATNIMSWELWNEVSNMDIDISANHFQRKVSKWHSKMADYIRSIDPFSRPVTTSMGGTKGMETLYSTMYKNLDIVQSHNYQNIDKAWSSEQFSHKLLNLADEARNLYPDKPFFVGEFAFGSTTTDIFKAKDPHAVDLHNSLWSSLFSGSIGPASFWYWHILMQFDHLRIFKPLLTFCNNLAIPSDSFTSHTTGKVVKPSLIFPNHLETYYMINAAEDTLYGWSQDTAFCYQSLRHLAQKDITKGHFGKTTPLDPKAYLMTLNPSSRPVPSSNSNNITIPIENQPIGTKYTVKWFDAETGLEMTAEKTTATVKADGKGKVVSFEFPSSIRDLKQKRINNTFGDAVFMITIDQGLKEESSTNGTAPKKKISVRPVKKPNQ